jgi:hypothetical protein
MTFLILSTRILLLLSIISKPDIAKLDFSTFRSSSLISPFISTTPGIKFNSWTNYNTYDNFGDINREYSVYHTIEDKSEAQKIKPIPNSGEFMSFDCFYEEEKKAGVVGKKVTLIDVSYSNVYQNKEALKR